MATDKARYTISVDDETLAEIEKFRYENKIATKAGATVELIRIGINELLSELDARKTPPTEEMVEEAVFTLLKAGLGRLPSEGETKRFTSALPILIKGVED